MCARPWSRKTVIAEQRSAGGVVVWNLETNWTIRLQKMSHVGIHRTKLLQSNHQTVENRESTLWGHVCRPLNFTLNTSFHSKQTGMVVLVYNWDDQPFETLSLDQLIKTVFGKRSVTAFKRYYPLFAQNYMSYRPNYREDRLLRVCSNNSRPFCCGLLVNLSWFFSFGLVSNRHPIISFH